MKPIPTDQPELEGLSQPREIVVSGDQLASVCAQLREQGAVIEAWEMVPGSNSQWRLEIVWPACGCEICQPPSTPSGTADPVLITADDTP